MSPTSGMVATADEAFQGPNLNVTLTCPECKIYPPDLIERFSEGDIVCGSCGLVLSDRVVDTRSEWRTFSNDDQNGDDPSRVGDAGNPLLDTEDLSTMISYAPDNGRAGKELNRAQSKSIVDKKDNALAAAYAKISQMCDGYQLPKIVQDSAKEVYKMVYDERPLRGKSQESIMAAAIFIGCRKAKVARSFKEIWALTNVPRKEIGKVFKIIRQVMQDKNATDPNADMFNQDNIQTTQTSAEDLIRRFCSHLGLGTQVTNGAEYIARRCKEVGVLAGRSPTTIAATVIYMAALIFGAELAPSKISDKTGVSDGTIKTSYKVMYEEKDKLIDPYWIESGKVKLENIPKS
ncbi:general RNA polymerase II transcription factor, TFIIB subunit [Suhomyces tanzawaensis NRRL Y-17324]|uniref:Transcription initiation factor IIB n=1 Tax=Suhomyces tanzawaensis NRRL Y-17324 TaxID=984487 RepID=A0A1E4SLQ1_9ASCO|nr:general RNA polymerase II transcription factor, TFIIB subunit [Suhomyces tanzawaensis NRRL Y-17324]ODV80327.1 general RNA polymerase II transcription factor, TFIIB subunit [Suhomyces tanzawaensis NRRL Y-17324]